MEIKAMSLFKYVMPLVAVCGILSAPAFGQQYDVDDFSADAINQRDTQAMKQFLRHKRGLFLEDKVNNLNISGDIRTQYKYASEKHRGVQLRGECSDEISDGLGIDIGALDDGANTELNHKPLGRHRFDLELNLYFDYVAERTWASAWLQFDNRMGSLECCRTISNATRTTVDEEVEVVDDALADVNEDELVPCESGTDNRISLRSAFFGYNVFEQGTSRLDVEAGRRPFYKVFDSRIQFDSNFDGLLVKYSNAFDGMGDFYVQGGAYVIDYVSKHFGWIVEAGLLDIANVNLDFKYSFKYENSNRSRYCRDDGDAEEAAHEDCRFMHRFGISQFTLAYHFNPEMLRTDVTVYGAFLVNHSARKIEWQTNYSDKENLGWYLGVMLGSVEGEGDWALDGNFQWVEAQSVQQCDVSGIGRGNGFGICLLPDALHQQFGNTNYMGFVFEGMYAITDNLTVSAEYDHVWQAERNVGGSHKYRRFELEFMYGW